MRGGGGDVFGCGSIQILIFVCGGTQISQIFRGDPEEPRFGQILAIK